MSKNLIVFSHLRWNFVYQRPQHLLSRLARHYKIYFFEEPLFTERDDFLQISAPLSNLYVCQPHTSVRSGGFHDDQIPALRTLLRDLVADRQLHDYMAWFYSPMALPLIQELAPRAVVYDCMDELSAFLNAPKQLLQREHALLKLADLVFTGGPSLYHAKRSRHRAVHCFPSSVDREHFSQALHEKAEHLAQIQLPRPRLGFFGVIDERLDLNLVAALANAHPQWQIVMVGPVVKIPATSLPQRPNIHYFGQRSYDELPQFLAGWDVCLLPFALNSATRFISPTKTLEYMAAERPIVSSPIADVVSLYGDAVYTAEGSGFIRACEQALGATDAERTRRVIKMRDILATTSWDKTAAAMHALLEGSAHSPHATNPAPLRQEADPGLLENRRTGPTQRVAETSHSTIVIGAGPTGLSAAHRLGAGSLLLEQNDEIGGLCRSIKDRGFTFDYAGHIMFSNDAYVHKLYDELLGGNVHWQNREAWIYSKNVYTRYPFQGALHGLPPDVLKECIVGAIEARFGELKKSVTTKPPAGAITCSGKAASITDCCADGIAEAAVPLGTIAPSGQPGGEARNFEEFIYKVWGKGVAKHFAIPYNRKLWAVPLTEMETSWLGGRVPLPDLEEMIDGALSPVAKPQGPNARFGYPLRGGFQALMDGFLPLLKGDLRLGAKVIRVHPAAHKLMLNDGSVHVYRHLISTAPLPKLIDMIGDEAPQAVRNAARQLRHVSVRCVNLGVGRENLTDKHWIYYPEDSVFHRIFVQGNASPHCNPAGGFALTCEITYSPSKPLPCEGEELIDRCIQDCINVGMIRSSDPILARNQIDLPCAYVVYDHARKHNVELIREWLLGRDIVLAGRYSEWEYYNSDHAFIAGRNAADAVTGAGVSRIKARAS